MKYIITESQNNSLKDSLNNLIDKSGVMAGIKAVGGVDNFVKIMGYKSYIQFVELIVNDLINNTELRGHHYYLFDCNISIALNHSHTPPIFAYIPPCFYRTLLEKYSLSYYFEEIIWEEYSKYIINTYLKNRGY